MKCPSCGTENKAGYRFCGVCGTTLAVDAFSQSQPPQVNLAVPAPVFQPNDQTDLENPSAFTPALPPRARVWVILGAVILGCVVCACITSLAAFFFFSNPDSPISFAPTATPPSASSLIAKSLDAVAKSKSVRIKTTTNYQGDSETLSQDFVSPDKVRYTSPEGCEDKRDQETIAIGQTSYTRCGNSAWSYVPTTTAISLDSIISVVKLSSSGCTPRGGVSTTKLGNVNMWQVIAECRNAMGSYATGTATWLVDPRSLQLRKWTFESQSGNDIRVTTLDFTNYDDPSISISAPAQASRATATPIPPPTWRLYASAIKPGGTSEGYTQYQVGLVAENQSNTWATLSFRGATANVETQEGYIYPVADIQNVAVDLQIPPKFRIAGYNPSYSARLLTVSFRAAQAARPVRIKIPGFDDVDLTAPRVFSFPTDQPRTAFKNVGDSIEIPQKAKITLQRASIAKSTSYSNQFVLTTEIVFVNLNQGYETTLDERCYLIDGIGVIRTSNLTSSGIFTAGPGLTVMKQSTWSLDPDPQARTNIKLVCLGEFKAIFNLDGTQ